jgi:hypothetical protein
MLLYACMHITTYVVCMYGWMNACMYTYLYICMYICCYTHTCITHACVTDRKFYGIHVYTHMVMCMYIYMRACVRVYTHNTSGITGTGACKIIVRQAAVSLRHNVAYLHRVCFFVTFTTSSNLQRWKTNRLKRSLVVQLFCIRQYYEWPVIPLVYRILEASDYQYVWIHVCAYYS